MFKFQLFQMAGQGFLNGCKQPIGRQPASGSFSSCISIAHLSTLETDISHAAAAKSLQSCPTLCDPIDGSPPGSPVPGILQARTLEWVAISFLST